MVENTDASLQADPYYQNMITYLPKMFPGYQPVQNGKVMSIANVGLAGGMAYNATSRAWQVSGIPAFPAIDPNGIMSDPLGSTTMRNPYLTANITVKNSSGTTLATTSTTVPVAFGGCCTCHISLGQQNGYTADPIGSFQYMGYLHSGKGAAGKIDFSKIDPDGDGVGGPIRCSWCHWDPAMGEAAAPGLPAVWPNYTILTGANFTKTDVKVSQYSFSDVLHRFHTQSSVVLTQWDPNIAKNCYDCHPGNGVNCYRDVMHSAGVNCYDCHGDLNQRVAAGQLTQPWQQSTLPTCNAPSTGATSAFSCHSSSTYPTPGTWAGVFGKYNNSRGHRGSILCSTCHGSPHALNPSTLIKDNTQLQALQGSSSYSFPTGKDSTYALGVCRVCHSSKSTTWGIPSHRSITQ
jgi:hypothetical protein